MGLCPAGYMHVILHTDGVMLTKLLKHVAWDWNKKCRGPWGGNVFASIVFMVKIPGEGWGICGLWCLWVFLALFPVSRFYTTTCIYMRDCIHVWEIISSTWWRITPATIPTTSEFSMSVVQIKMLCHCSQFFVRIALVNDLLSSSCGISAIMLSVFQINDFCLGRLCRVELRLGYILIWSKIYFFHDSYKQVTQNRCD